jgi:HAD superfamily hydrolase (TIGR01509 family)
LTLLTNKTKIKTAIVSSSSKSNVNNFLEISGLRSHFEFTLDNSSVKEQKPHPEIYSTAMSLAKVDPKFVSVIEDSELGILSARRAGIEKVIKYPFSKVDEKFVKDLIE